MPLGTFATESARGHGLTEAALEAPLLDAELRAEGMTFEMTVTRHEGPPGGAGRQGRARYRYVWKRPADGRREAIDPFLDGVLTA
ncbi:hypothetical protein OHB49_36000 [Streptomyces sp. NBC_01717]|uniref:hypothetical protein n=1 Tax=Streptomyces sp. NBC_01717 TaxID=2975918 RepID=UPI002E354543|nr:hypothetical protein [Streptomyces sp. NBC_01717]